MLVCLKLTKSFPKRTCLPFNSNLETEKLCGKGFLNSLPWLPPELWSLFLLPPNVISCPLEKSVLLYTSLFYPTWNAKLKQIYVCCQFGFLFGFFFSGVLFLLLEIKALAPGLKFFFSSKLPFCPKLSLVVRLKKIPVNLQLLQFVEIPVFLHIWNCQGQTFVPLSVQEQVAGVRSWSV